MRLDIDRNSDKKQLHRLKYLKNRFEFDMIDYRKYRDRIDFKMRERYLNSHEIV